jgi:Ca-activated chloride channel family protein
MIRFAHIEYFYLLLLIPVFIGIYWAWSLWRKKALKRFGEITVIKPLMPSFTGTKPFVKFIFLMLAYIFLVIALTDPQVGARLEKVKREGIDIYIALDVSNSMLAEDIKPNRLERAKMAISNLVDRLQGDRIGIIVFAGNAYKQLPLTTDYSAAKLFLSAVDTKIVPTQGTAIGEAINMATESFDDSKNNKAIIVITDGENHEDDAIEAAKAAAEKGIKVFTIGMGLPEGSPIPIYDRNGNRLGFKKDKSGKTVVTKLNEDMLRQIAAAGNGSYVRASNSSTGLKKILDDINKIQKQEIETRQFTDYEDRFQIFLWATLIFIIIELLISDKKSKLAEKFDFFGKEK